jgi:hypothetical protein
VFAPAAAVAPFDDGLDPLAGDGQELKATIPVDVIGADLSAIGGRKGVNVSPSDDWKTATSPSARAWVSTSRRTPRSAINRHTR